MVQGSVGNCWIMSAVSALAEWPERVDNLMLNDGISTGGIYGVNMYALGVPFTQYVDDYLPINDEGLVFANKGKDNSIWAAVVEKAYAKRYGNYKHTEGGWMATGVAQMNGSPYVTLLSSEMSDEDLWNAIKSSDDSHHIITAGTDCVDYTKNNMPGCHAYTVLRATTIEKDGQTIKMLKIRNPWGEDMYTSEWSDRDGAWTHEKV